MDAKPQSKRSMMPNWSELNPFRERQQSQVVPQENNRTADRIEDDSDSDPNKNNKTTKKGQEGDDPLLKFDSLWQPNMDGEGKPIPDEDNSGPKSYLPQLDAKKFDDFVGKLNFTQDIDQTDMDALKAGGEGAITATINVINKASRRSMKSAIAAASRMAEQGFNTANQRFTSEVPNHFRDLMTEDQLSSTVGIMQNPAFTPMVSMVKKQYLKKFPKATPSEVNAAVRQYFDFLGSELNKKPTQKNKQSTNRDALRKGDPEANFLDWISTEIGDQSRMFQDNPEDEEDTSQQ